MLSLSNISSAGARNYYQSAAGEYYDKESKTTEWQGQIATELRLTGKTVDLDIFENLSKGMGLADEKLVKSAGLKNHRVGIDLTFSAPKSVSILSLQDSNLREAHQNAVSKTLDYIESNYIQTRTMENGEKQIETTGKFIVAKFEHHSNRNQEPQLHTHSVVMNLTKDSKDQFKTVHNDKLYLEQKNLGQIYRLELAKNIIEKGYSIEITDRSQGLFEIKGISPEILKAFSSRREEVEKRANELREEYKNVSEARLKEMAALDSRAAKGKELSREEMEGKVNKTLSQFNSSLHDLQKLSLEQGHESNQEKKSAEHYVKESIQGIEENQSAWKKSDALDHSAKLSLGKYSIREIIEGFEKLQRSGYLTPVGDKNNTQYFSSQSMQKTESKIIDYIKSGKGESKIHIDQQEFEKIIGNSKLEYTPGQKEAMKLILTSKDHLIGIQGDAGTGKTFVMDSIRSIFEKKGYEVKGLAPTGKAVQELEEGANIKGAQTIDSFLIKEKNDLLKSTPLQKGQVWIIDEVGMVGSKKMEKILRESKENNAKVILVGDVKQFESIDQGNVFKDLQKEGSMSFVEMKDVLRQKTDDSKAIVSELNNFIRNGQNPEHLKAAFDILKNKNNILELPDLGKRLSLVKSEYLDSIKKGNRTLIITSTNSERKAINSEIREELKDQGRIHKEGKQFDTFSASNLSGKDKMYAENYQKGQMVFFQGRINDIGRGTQGEITDIHMKNNGLTITHFDKNHSKLRTTYLSLNSQKDSVKLQAFNKEVKELSIGDKIIFGKNDNKLGVKNGQVGTIKELGKDGDCLVSTDKRDIAFNLAGKGSRPYQYVDYAYALTEYKSQGTTVDKLIWSTDAKSVNFNSGYVAITRTRKDIKIFTDNIEKLEKNMTRQSSKVSTLEFKMDKIELIPSGSNKLEHSKNELELVR